MKAKTFILSFLMMFCSYAFGQHQSYWGEPSNQLGEEMVVITQVVIDGELQGNNIELGAFCGNELRGSAFPDATDNNIIYIVVKGNTEGERITYKLYDHNHGIVLDFVKENALTFEADARIGSISGISNGLLKEEYRTEFNSVAKVNDVKYGTFEGAYAAAEDDDVLTLLQDIEFSNIFVLDKAITFDGNNHTIASTASRAINVDCNGSVAIKNLTIVASGERAINVINKPATLTINNVTATAANYAVNVAASAARAKVTITDSELTGLATLNISSDYINVTVDGTQFNCNDQNINESYGAITISDGKEVKVTVTSSEFSVQNGSHAGYIFTEDGEIIISDNQAQQDDVKYIVAKIGLAGYFTLAEAIEAAKTGETVVLIRDIKASEIITIDKAITLDGNGKTLTSTAGRAINVDCEGNVGIKDLTIVASGERAINVINKPATLTINNVTATAANYAVNVAASAASSNVTITGSELTGLATLNISSDNINVTVDGTQFNCNDQNINESYGAITISDGKEVKVTVTSSEFSVQNGSHVGYIFTEDGEIIISDNQAQQDDVKYIVAKIGLAGYFTLAEAIEAAKAGETITLVRNITSSSIVTIDKAITLDGNNNTLTSKAGRAINVSGADGVTIQNLTIDAKGERAINIIQNATNVTIDKVTATAYNYTVNIASSAPKAVVAIKNSTLNGLCTVNVSAAGANVTVDNSTVNCNDNNTTAGESYAALSLNREAIGGSIVATNSTVNVTEGSDSHKGRNGAEDGTVNGTDDVITIVAVITYPNNTYYYAFETLASAIEFAKENDVVTIIRNTAGAGVSINKDVTIDFNGKTYTLNEAAGSKGTKSQGFQLLPEAENVTIKNGTIKVAEGTNVVWMFNDYAQNLTIKDLTIDCKNMVWTKSVYLLVANNEHGTNPKPVFSNVKIENYDTAKRPHVLLENNTQLTAQAGLTVVTDPGFVVDYKNGVYSVNTAVARIGETYYNTFAEALEAVQNNDVIELFDVVGDESKTEIDFSKKITFSIKGNAPKYALPVVTFTNAKVNIEGSTILIPELDARQNATINVNNSTVYSAGGDGIVKSYYNGTINIDKTSTVYTMQVTTMGYITVAGKLNATWQTNVYGNGLITLNAGAQFNTAALHLTAKEYSGRDNTDDGRKDKPAEIIVNKDAKFVVGKVYSSNNADYSYNSSKGINIGTIAGKSAVLTLNGGNVEIYMANGEKVNIGAGGKVEVGASTMKTFCRAENGKVGINNNGTINFSDVTSELHIAQEGLNITTSKTGYAVKYVDGVYKLVANLVENTTKGVKYPSLEEAIANAESGNTIKFLGNITEDVTINKNLTIDGNKEEGISYTGTMTGDAGFTITIQNANFVNAGFAKTTKSTTGTYTFKDCIFNGNRTYLYPIKVRGAKTVNVENCEVSDYYYSFLYVYSGTQSVNVNNVIVKNCPDYAVYFASGVNKANIQNLTVIGSGKEDGLLINNSANRALTLTGCKFENVKTAVNHSNGTNSITCTLYGENEFGTAESSEYAKYVLCTENATLKASKGLNVTTTVQGCVVKYENGVYSVQEAIAAIGNKYFASIQDAINAAEDGNTIVVLKDINLNNTELQTLDGSFNTYFKVEGKTVTIDLNGAKISGIYNETKMLVGVFSTDNGGHIIILNDSKNDAVVDLKSGNDKVYALIANYEDGCSITINGGTYILDKAIDSHMYTGGDEGIVVNGGKFILCNIGTPGINNGKPWIFNVLGGNEGNVVVNGGTFNADINHQFWANEVYVPETSALQNNGDGTWTIVPAEAYVEEIATSTGSSTRNVGYATLEEALTVANSTTVGLVKDSTTVGLVKDITTEGSYTINSGKTIVLDLNDNTITGVDKTSKNFGLIQNNGTLTVNAINGGGMKLKAEVNSGWGRYSAVISNNPGATLTVNGGTIEHLGGTDMAYGIDALTNGGIGDVNTTINGGTIKSTYRAVRQFLNSDSKENNLTVNGGTLEGANKSIFFHDPSTKANNGTVTVSANAVLNGDVYLYVTAGSTEWPVEVSIANAALSTNSKVLSANVPETYAVENIEEIWTVVRVSTQTLASGWNWFSHYVEGSVLEQLKDQLLENGISIKTMGAFINNNGTWSGNLKLTSVEKMYKINVNAQTPINVSGKIVDPSEHTIALGTKWNWIGYPLNVPMSLNEAYANVAQDGDYIKTNGAFAEYSADDQSWHGNLRSLTPGIGYMYFNAGTDATDVFTYSYPQSKASVEANITAENNYWVPTSQFANNMTMVAMLDVKGDNYEVAAFVNGEVRGSARPIYVESLDAYMFFLTIHGENVEEMTFKCYDIDTDTEYALSNVMNYSNDAMVGSLKNPYLLSRGTLGLEEVSSFNIYPNPTTTDREINLSTTCDKVEVFNALGVKVAEYQNVDTIDALETAGIYVIRVTNNGNVKHCRLVVK